MLGLRKRYKRDRGLKKGGKVRQVDVICSECQNLITSIRLAGVVCGTCEACCVDVDDGEPDESVTTELIWTTEGGDPSRLDKV